MESITCICGQEMAVAEGEVTHHLTPDGTIDHDADSDHVAIDEREYSIF